jgi:hypothetical protein
MGPLGLNADQEMMTNLLRMGACAVLCLVVVGCGDDEETNENKPAGNAGTINTQVATQSAADAFASIETAINSMDGEAAAGTMLQVGLSSQSIVTPGGASTPMGVGSTSQALGEGTCDCTANTCTFSDCGDAGGFVINGTLAWTATSMDCDYTVTGTSAGNTYNFGIQCALTYGPDQLDGTVSTDGSFEIEGAGMAAAAYTWDSDLTFNSVTYSGGSPNGGSMNVSSTVSISGQTYTASTTVSFP